MRLRFRNFTSPADHCHFQVRRFTSGSSTGVHEHDFHEVFWIDDGQGWHLVNGERRRLSPGALTLVRSDDRHGFQADDGQSFRLVNVAFPRKTWRYLVRRYAPREGDPMTMALPAREFFLSAPHLTELGIMTGELVGGARGASSVERFLLNLLYLLTVSRPAGTTASQAPAWLREACSGIGDPSVFRDGTAALVRLSGRSAEHVAREVRRWMGKTPTDVVNDARLAHAASRLTETDDAILRIAFDCGFENVSHFYRLFRARYGATPGQYRSRRQRLVDPS
jgi:AraC family transcriptional regulator, dual regulator of chb operon